MDPRRATFLFGDVPSGADTDDEDVRHRLVRQRFLTENPGLDDGSPVGEFSLMVHQLVADQIAEDEPPEVWRTAERLLDSGLEPRLVLSNLALAANSWLVDSLRDGEDFDDARYLDELDRLPLPSVAELLELFVAMARERRSISADELVDTVLASFRNPADGDGDGDGHLQEWIELALDELLDVDPSMMMLPPDVLVHVPTLMNGAILTHRLTEEERSGGWIATGADLAPLLRWSDPLVWASGSEVEIDTLDDDDALLGGDPGWLEPFAPDTLIGFRIEGNTLALEAVGDPGPPDATVVEAARAAYQREVEEPWLPVRAEEIAVGMQLDDRGILSTPTVPLSELLARAGLEQRGLEFAHEDSVWRAAHTAGQTYRLINALPDTDSRHRAAQVLDLLHGEERDQAGRREALSTLRDPHLLSVITDELLDQDDDDEQLQEVTEFAEDLLAAARRPADGAPARWLLAVVSERRGDPVAGQAQLELAVQADPDFAPAVDRLAWYLSDRGDAAGAARLWRRLGADEDSDDDLREVAPFAMSAPSGLGRNEPCWCGSGRKFKHCHLGMPPAFPLPERVGWLCRKTVAYLERRGGRTFEDVYDCAVVRADGDDSHEALGRALSDPLVMDVVLHEGGWFERFIAERGGLLPDDEALLATAWAFVDRTLYEVVASRPGDGMDVRDLRSAEVVEVRERTFSRQARIGQVFCGRAVPDGETHQFIGGVFAVATGQEKPLLDLLDRRDGKELLAWVATGERPPRLATREGEDLRDCRAVVEVPDPDAARVVLDRVYEAGGKDQWHEHHELANGESILRASMALQGNRITVETMSEPRVERVLGVLMGAIAGATVVSDERGVLDPSTLPPGPREPALSPDDPAVREALRNFIAERERVWCDEEIPALGGLTPRQAAEDPAGRESLERLLAEYGTHVDPDQDPELVVQHPDRLRTMLGLE